MSDYPTESDKAINRVALLILWTILVCTITAALTWEIAS